MTAFHQSLPCQMAYFPRMPRKSAPLNWQFLKLERLRRAFLKSAPLKSDPSKADFINEAVEVAKAFPGKAARVQWTREDDLRHDYLHTVSIEHLEASLSSRG